MMLVYSTGVIYDRHLQSSKYVYNTGHRWQHGWVTDIFSNFYLEKNYKFANNSTTTTKAREKTSTDLDFLEF